MGDGLHALCTDPWLCWFSPCLPPLRLVAVSDTICFHSAPVCPHRPPDALRSAAAAVTPLRPGPRALTRNPRAEWHWQLLRLHVKAMTAYRCVCVCLCWCVMCGCAWCQRLSAFSFQHCARYVHLQIHGCTLRMSMHVSLCVCTTHACLMSVLSPAQA